MEKGKLLNSPGEQSYQHSRADNNNWNGTFTANYRLGKMHMLTFNHVLNTFSRSNTSLLAKEEQSDAIAKETRKNISGLLPPDAVRNLELIRVRQVLQPVCCRTGSHRCQPKRLCAHYPQRTFHRVWGCRNLFHPAGTAGKTLL